VAVALDNARLVHETRLGTLEGRDAAGHLRVFGYNPAEVEPGAGVYIAAAALLLGEVADQLLEILVASDGSSDRTNAIVERDYAGRARLLALPRAGKTAAQNHAAAAATGEILVFSDATTMYDRGIGVLLIMRGPGGFLGGRVEADWVVDIVGFRKRQLPVGSIYRTG